MKWLLSAIICTVLLWIPLHVLIGPGVPYTHDGENHLARFANYTLALREGQIPPRVAPNLLSRFGYPVFNYNYPLASIVAVPFAVVDIPYEHILKIEYLLAISLGVAGMWVWFSALKKTVTQSAIWFGVATVLTAPYLQNAVAVRGSIGEVWAISLLPWVFWTIDSIFHVKNKPKHSALFQFLVGVGMSTAWLLSHNVLVAFGLPVVLGYAVVRFATNWQLWKQWLLQFVWAIALSLWFWLPALAEQSLVTVSKVNLVFQAVQHQATVAQLVFAPVQFGYSTLGTIDGLSMMIGLVQLVVLFVAFFALWGTAESILLGGVVLCLLLQLPISASIWHFLPQLSLFQFPWRLSGLVLPLFGLLAVRVFSHASIGWKCALIFMLCVQAVALSRVKAVDRFHRTDVDYTAFAQSSSTNYENVPVGFDHNKIVSWPTTVSSIPEGSVQVRMQYWKGSDRLYTVSATQSATVIEPTMKFAGWQTQVDGTQVQYTDSADIGGRLAYQVEPGEHIVRTRFTQWTASRVMGNTVSLIAGVGLALFAVIFFKRKVHAK